MKNQGEVGSIRPRDNKWLERLAEIPAPVKKLFYLGKLPREATPTVSIVGSRRPTTYGREITLKLAEKLARRGVIIVSGLALGHDALAAEGALNGGGTTVAVLGTPLPKITPTSNRALGEKIIASGGAILSEVTPAEMAEKESIIFYKTTFKQRNRIVSGLANVLVVVEAGAKSGTLNTAAHAIEQGRTVMAVPGNITSPLSVGCNRLIAGGARPLLAVKDVLEELGIEDEPKQLKLHFRDKNEQTVFNLIAGGEHDGEALQRESKLSAPDFNMALTMLELGGVVRSLGANQWGLK